MHSPGVDADIDALPAWQAAAFRELRALIHEAGPEIEETVERTIQPYFVLEGNVAAFLAAKDHVNVVRYDPLIDDRAGMITAGHDDQTGRRIAIREGERINGPAVLALIRQIAEHNQAGGWRKLR